MNPSVHVAVGVILDSQRNVLISLRHADNHQGGLWEFPGGKLEQNETLAHALKRELAEELGIQVKASSPFVKLLHHYFDKTVLLDVFLITEFDGIPSGLEGQSIQWCSIDKLVVTDFPEANHQIIKLLQLPKRLAITPEFQSKRDLMTYVQRLLELELKLIQFRQNQLDSAQYIQWANSIIELCNKAGATVLINNDLATFRQIGACGYHATSTRLMRLRERPVATESLFSASCHNQAELMQAERLGSDLALLSPVKDTTSHPDSPLLGWNGFAKLANSVSLPVFALGGLKESDLDSIRRNGGVGLAAIRGFS
jgi:8-oxo-dGTP diphosphatase